MNDSRDAFERELKSRLAVDSSSDLEARIRERVFADDPAKRRARFAPVWVSAAAAAIVLPVVVLLWEGHEPGRVPSSGPEQIAVTPAVESPPTLTEEAQSDESQAKKSKKSVAAAVTTPTTFLVEVATPSWPVDQEIPSEPIELQPLHGVDLLNALSPIPQTPVPSFASLKPINIEPLSLAAQRPGVNE